MINDLESQEFIRATIRTLCPICHEPFKIATSSDTVKPGRDWGKPEMAFVRVQKVWTTCCGHEFGRWFECDAQGARITKGAK